MLVPFRDVGYGVLSEVFRRLECGGQIPPPALTTALPISSMYRRQKDKVWLLVVIHRSGKEVWWEIIG